MTIHLKDTVTAPGAVTVRAAKCTGAAVESHLVVCGETLLATCALYWLASLCVYIFCMTVEVSPSVETLSTNTTREPTGSISSIFLFISFSIRSEIFCSFTIEYVCIQSAGDIVGHHYNFTRTRLNMV